MNTQPTRAEIASNLGMSPTKMVSYFDSFEEHGLSFKNVDGKRDYTNPLFQRLVSLVPDIRKQKGLRVNEAIEFLAKNPDYSGHNSQDPERSSVEVPLMHSVEEETDVDTQINFLIRYFGKQTVRDILIEKLPSVDREVIKTIGKRIAG